MEQLLSVENLPPINHPRHVLVIGPSGAGKTTLIREVAKRDPRIILNPINTDRPIREGEFEKFYLSREELEEKEKRGEFYWVDPAYGNKYAVPKKPVDDILSAGNVAIQDYSYNSVIKRGFIDDLYHVIYVLPPSLGELKLRLQRDGRDPLGGRFAEGREELLGIIHGDGFKNNKFIDDVIVNKDLTQAVTAMQQSIYRSVA